MRTILWYWVIPSLPFQPSFPSLSLSLLPSFFPPSLLIHLLSTILSLTLPILLFSYPLHRFFLTCSSNTTSLMLSQHYHLLSSLISSSILRFLKARTRLEYPFSLQKYYITPHQSTTSTLGMTSLLYSTQHFFDFFYAINSKLISVLFIDLNLIFLIDVNSIELCCFPFLLHLLSMCRHAWWLLRHCYVNWYLNLPLLLLFSFFVCVLSISPSFSQLIYVLCTYVCVSYPVCVYADIFEL